MRALLLRSLSLLLVFAVVAAACGGDDGEPSATDVAEEPADGSDAEDESEPAESDADESDAAEPGTGEADAASLVGVCPDPVVIQTDWYPSAERGPFFQFLGDDYEIDVENKIISGSLVARGGDDTGIGIEIRAGGPAIGFAPVTTHMYVDTDVTFGVASHDGAALAYEDTPTLSVVAPFEKNPQIVMWDPETYPDVESIADLGELGVTINVFPGGAWQEILTLQGVVPADSWDPSFDGTPARFVSEGGAIAQQGFASAEPYEYEALEEWGKPVAFELVYDTGIRFYSQPLAIRSAELEELRPCLERFVPMAQQATVDYIDDPVRSNRIIIEMIDALAEVIYTAGEAEWAAGQIRELGLISNGPDDVLGNFDLERVQEGIDQMRDAGIDVPADLTAEQLATNEFIDPTIGT